MLLSVESVKSPINPAVLVAATLPFATVNLAKVEAPTLNVALTSYPTSIFKVGLNPAKAPSAALSYPAKLLGSSLPLSLL